MSETERRHEPANCPICRHAWDQPGGEERLQRAFKAGASIEDCVRHFDVQRWDVENILRAGVA